MKKLFSALFIGEKKTMDIKICFIKENYFTNHSYLLKVLDPNDLQKQTRRSYLCVEIECQDNKFYIPLRTNLGSDVRKFGRIGHYLPSEKRPNAGLDYRHALIINDNNYIEEHKEQIIPNAQYNKLKTDYNKIQKEFAGYVNKYIKMVKKGRADKEPLFRDTSLVNFHAQLNI